MYKMEKKKQILTKFSKLRNSQSIFKAILLCTPLLALCYGVVKFNEFRQKQSSLPAIRENSSYAEYMTSSMTVRDRAKEAASGIVLEILMDDRVRKKGVFFVVSILKHPNTQAAVVDLLKNILIDQKSKSFNLQAVVFTTELLTQVVATPEVIEATRVLFEKMLKREEIIEATVDMLKYVTKREEAKDIMSQYYQAVFLRKDILDSVSELLSQGAYQGLADEKTVEEFAQFMIRVVNTESVRTGIMESFFYRPLKEYFWFISQN
mmetsp:Transcript_9590/g.10737  ORF Transcript_9590/g.10737 Transcript_9590/m.10737 type:complete len:264 (-) Transcript_9590:73-864(-)